MGMMIIRHKVRDYGLWRPGISMNMPKCRGQRGSEPTRLSLC